MASASRLPRSMWTLLLTAGFALALGPLLATGLTGFAAMQAAVELNPRIGGILLVGFGVSPWGFAIPLVGFGVLVLAYVFRRLRRLEHDTEGLV